VKFSPVYCIRGVVQWNSGERSGLLCEVPGRGCGECSGEMDTRPARKECPFARQSVSICILWGRSIATGSPYPIILYGR
jgi:hypothetical protein